MNSSTAIVVGALVLAIAGIGVVVLSHKDAPPPPPPKATGVADVVGGLVTGALTALGVH